MYKKTDMGYFMKYQEIQNISYFDFNNWAYFTNERENAAKDYENNVGSFRALLKYIVSLKNISLESSRKVISLRMFIYKE